jgi:hypothetical protein
MEPDLLGFFQDRIASAYEEQRWAIALVGALNGFLAGYARRFLTGVRSWVLVAVVLLLSAFALLFVWSRHFIFMFYDGCAKMLLESTPYGMQCTADRLHPAMAFLARWSGVTLYSLIIIGLAVAAMMMLRAGRPAGRA